MGISVLSWLFAHLKGCWSASTPVPLPPQTPVAVGAIVCTDMFFFFFFESISVRVGIQNHSHFLCLPVLLFSASVPYLRFHPSQH